MSLSQGQLKDEDFPPYWTDPEPFFLAHRLFSTIFTKKALQAIGLQGFTNEAEGTRTLNLRIDQLVVPSLFAAFWYE